MGFAVKGILRLLKKQFKEDNIDLTLEQYFLLNILENEEGLILQDLADIVDRDKSAVARHINSLEENHFVARTKDPRDNRRKILLVTKQGINMLERARKADEEINLEITRNLSDEELANLEEIVTDIYEYAMSGEHC